MTNIELYELVIKLSKKVELLENEVSVLKNTIKITRTKYKNYDISSLIHKPHVNLSDWICNIVIENKHIHDIFNPDYGIMYSFKQCIIDNIKNSKKGDESELPFYKHVKNGDLYIYNNKNDICEWVIFDITHMEILTKHIWLKFLKLYMKIEYTLSENEDIRDLQKQKIMNMRIKLYEVDKNRRELMKWFSSLF
jgi:hypothetical protein